MWFEHMGWPTAFQGLWRGALGVLGASLLVLCLAGLLATSAWPRMHAGPGVMDGGRRLGGGAAAPLDGFTTPSAAYSLRRLRSAYAGPALRLRRASDNAELDISFLGYTGFTGAPIDTAAANAHCAATTCFFKTWYDQSGLARDVTQANPAQQFTYVADCGNGLPCARSPTNQVLSGPSVTPSSGPTSFAAVGRTDGSGGLCTLIIAGQQQLAMSGANWLLWNGGGFGVPQTLGVWHAGNAVINSAASVINLDGVETTGSVTPLTTAGAVIVGIGDAANPCSYREAVWWNNYALTAGERTVLQTNQKSFWGTP